MSGDAPTVFVVEDDVGVARAIARMLRAGGWQVATFHSAEAFLSNHEGGPGCLVLDVGLPGLDGLALQQQLREVNANLAIVFLTGQGDIPMSVRAMKAGAADFLTKPVDAATLDGAIRAALEMQSAANAHTVNGHLVRDRIAQLSDREREVLDAVCAGKLNKQIAFDLGIVEQTVKYHRARIMQRLGAKSLAELMHLVATARPR